MQLFFFGSCPLTFHIPEHSTEPHCHGAIHTVPVRTLSRAVSIRGDARKQLPSSPASGWLTGPQALTASPAPLQETASHSWLFAEGYILSSSFPLPLHSQVQLLEMAPMKTLYRSRLSRDSLEVTLSSDAGLKNRLLVFARG